MRRRNSLYASLKKLRQDTRLTGLQKNVQLSGRKTDDFGISCKLNETWRTPVKILT